MSSTPTQDRVASVWGAAAHTWSGEVRPQRAMGFDLDMSGRQRVLGFPAEPSPPINFGRLRVAAHPVRSYKQRGTHSAS